MRWEGSQETASVVPQEVASANTGKVIEVLIFDIPGKRLIKLEVEKKMYAIENIPDLKTQQAKETENRQSAQTGTSIDPQSLGTRDIEGISTLGYRTAIAGQINGKTVPAIRERWYSPELQVDLSSRTSTDLQQTERVLTHIQRGEPDASLFQIPSDYVQDPMNAAGTGSGAFHH